MRRRYRSSTGTRRRISRGGRRSPPGQVTPRSRKVSRVSSRDPNKIVRARHTTGGGVTVVVRSGRIANPRSQNNELSRRHRDRREALRQHRQRARTRLSSSPMSLRRYNENASRNKTTRSVCARKKEARRGVIIATGYGGINGARNYKRRKTCGLDG